MVRLLVCGLETCLVKTPISRGVPSSGFVDKGEAGLLAEAECFDRKKGFSKLQSHRAPALDGGPTLSPAMSFAGAHSRIFSLDLLNVVQFFFFV